tara:strand:+ start:5076 stop:5330 length:255 start_codon:yes stop_codon:yes gene_type:complete
MFQRRERWRRGEHPARKQRQASLFTWPLLVDFQKYGNFRGFFRRAFAAGLGPDPQSAITDFLAHWRHKGRDPCRDLVQAAQKSA